VMFGRKVTFGKRQPSLAEFKKMRPTPDSDGVTRVFSKELWNDPQIGSFLREVGLHPDDTRNIKRTAEDYIALFAAAKKRLQERTETFNREMAERHGYCRAAPFLIIDDTIWDGEHGAFLHAQMDLVSFDDWNVLMLATDVRTKELCGLAGHPGSLPAITQDITKRIIAWKARHESALEAFGITVTGGQGITREQYEAEERALRQEIVDYVASMKSRIVNELLARPAELDYSFEIQSVLPQILWQTSESKELLERVGIAYNMKGNHVPAFSDPGTVVALWREPDNVRAAMLKAGWSILPYEGELPRDKAQFLIPRFREIHSKVKSGAYEDNALKYAVFDLVGFAHKATTGELLGAGGKPICSQYTQGRINNASPPCAFDLSKALTAITADPKNWPPAGSGSPTQQ
jgi:hypothetical protein